MIRIATTLACAMGLSACATLPDWVVAPSFLGSGVTADLGHYSFDWHLSGDRQLAPLQVFDNGKETWLQFMPGQFIPAIFRRTQNGKQPLTYTRRGDYLIIVGVWPELVFRGGSSQAVAKKRTVPDSIDSSDVQPSAFSVSSSVPIETQNIVESPDSVVIPLIPSGDHGLERGPSDVQVPGLANAALATYTADSSDVHILKDVSTPADPSANGESSGAFSDDIGRFTHASFESMESVQLTQRPDGITSQHGELSLSYGVRLQDQNLRKALHRWAVQARWTFAPEHWAVDVDIPVSGEAVFDGPFQDAVQDLLSATELAERPLRPCFYSNRVLRVVSYSQSCDRSTGGRES